MALQLSEVDRRPLSPATVVPASAEGDEARLWGVPDLSPPPVAVGLDVRGVYKSYGTRNVLQDVNLSVAPGEFVGIVGKSGCGKSTLLRLISGLEAATQGEIVTGRETVRGLNRQARFMFQEPRLLPWKRVRENVALGLPPPDARKSADAALSQVGLADRARDWPSVLSGGQRQRVALARALASRPPLLLLDEPLGALDALTRLEMQTLIEQLQAERGFTALLVTHDIEEAISLCDRVILLEDGQITAEVQVPLVRPRQRGTTAFVTLKEELLARLLGLPATFDI